MKSLPELPDELRCFHILPRLPGNSLMRFRCVCKSWYALTRNPSFIETHRNCNIKRTNLFLTTWDRATNQQHFFSIQINQVDSPSSATRHLLSLPTPREKYRYPCLYNALTINGLACLYFSDTPPLRSKHDHPVHLFNPCTREAILLPHSTSASKIFRVAHHFGFCPLTNEYQVIQVKLSRLEHMIPKRFVRSINIFKLGTSLWREVEVDRSELPFDYQKCEFHKRSVCVHGAIHWTHKTQAIIVVFDLKDERFRVISVPNEYRALRFSPTIGNIVDVGGCLALVDETDFKLNILRLWILKDYQNQVWATESIIFPSSLWDFRFRPVPFGTIYTGELLLQSPSLDRLDSAGVRVHLYNMKTKSFRTIEIILPDWAFSSFKAQMKLLPSYVDSLVPLH